LFLDSSLPPESEIVIEGRALLAEGDAVIAKELERVPVPGSDGGAHP
jgi:hypothetical protein